MVELAIIKTDSLEHRVPNPVNITLTQKQCVDGEWLDDLRSEQNFRHFANKLNSSVLGARFKRFGKRLAMLVVRENDATCSIPDDHIDPRRSALFMARSILREVRDGDATC